MKNKNGLLIPLVALSALAFGCSYDDNETTGCNCDDTSYCGLKDEKLQCLPKKNGGESCQTADECKTSYCSANICSCNKAVNCSNSDYYCDIPINETPEDRPACREKQDNGKTCTADKECKSGTCAGGFCKDLALGGKVCSKDTDCKSEKCSDGVCECSSTAACISGYSCDLSRGSCYKKSSLGETCETNDQCSSGSCVMNNDKANRYCYTDASNGELVCPEGKICGCTKSADCSDGFVCDSGRCREIVPCPGKFRDKQCFATTYLVPNQSWARGEINENAVASNADRLGKNFNISFPENSIYLCIHPVYSYDLNNIIERLSTKKDESELLTEIEKIAADPSFSADILLDFLKNKPYVWSIVYEKIGCAYRNELGVLAPKTDSDGTGTIVCNDATSAEECQCVGGVPNKTMSFDAERGKRLLATVFHDNEGNVDMKSVIRFVYQNVVIGDSRVRARLEPGCLELYMQQDITVSLEPNKSFANQWNQHNVYLAFNVTNSSLMSGTQSFEVSMKSSSDDDDQGENSAVAYKSNVLKFPIQGQIEPTLFGRYDFESSTKTDDIKYTFKPTYLKLGSSYSPIDCNSYYTKVTSENGEPLCEDENACHQGGNNQTTNPSSTCTASIFTRINNLQILIELKDEDLTSRN